MDGGDFGEAPRGRSTWKTFELFKAMQRIGYDAICLGERDLFNGFADSVRSIDGAHLLFSSFDQAKTDMSLPAFKIVERSGIRFGAISVIASTVQRRMGTNRYDVENFLRTELNKIKSQNVDFTATVFFGPPHELIALSKKFPEVDLWLQSNGDRRPIRVLDTIQDALVVSGGDRGREIGLITIEKEKNGARVASSFNQIILTPGIADSPKAKPYLESYKRAATASRKASRSSSSSSR